MSEQTAQSTPDQLELTPDLSHIDQVSQDVSLEDAISIARTFGETVRTRGRLPGMTDVSIRFRVPICFDGKTRTIDDARVEEQNLIVASEECDESYEHPRVSRFKFGAGCSITEEIRDSSNIDVETYVEEQIDRHIRQVGQTLYEAVQDGEFVEPVTGSRMEYSDPTDDTTGYRPKSYFDTDPADSAENRFDERTTSYECGQTTYDVVGLINNKTFWSDAMNNAQVGDLEQL